MIVRKHTILQRLKDVIIKNDLLGYPRLDIYQDSEMFHFSIDSMLLADFVRIKKGTKKILDLGTGNAAIPLFLTLKTSAAIHGIEIQEAVYNLGVRSVKENNLESQIQLHLGDMKEASQLFKNQAFDIVISNPPFFKYKPSSVINKNEYLTIARHEIKITLEEIIQLANKLLKNSGSFYLIHRPERLTDVLIVLRENNLEPKRLKFVYPKQNSKPNHILIEAMKNTNHSNLEILAPLVIYDEDGKWTEDTLKIYNYGRD